MANNRVFRDESDPSLPILGRTSDQQNFNSVNHAQTGQPRQQDVHVDVSDEEDGETIRPRVLGRESANVRINLLQNSREQASNTNLKYYAYAVSIINIPQAVAAIAIVLDKWNVESCNVDLDVWALVHAFRLLASVYIGWILKWEDTTNPLEMSEHGRWVFRLKGPIDNFGIIWLVMGNFWLFSAADDCVETAPTIYYLCSVLIYIGFTIVFLPCIIVVLMLPFVCFCLPCVLRVLSRIAQVSRKPQGVSKAELGKLPITKYQPGIFNNGEEQCAICLTDYKVNEELRLLPCDKRHHFHVGCVDEWLLMNATCPICRAHIGSDIEQSSTSGSDDPEQGLPVAT